MKFCPTCQTRYDEEILRYCTKDGTLLVEEEPNFVAMPSESFEQAEDDLGEETVVRTKPVVPPVPETAEDTSYGINENTSQRLVVPTTATAREQDVRARAATFPPPTPPKSNTAMVVLTTIVLTMIVLAGVGGLFYFLGNRSASDANINVNTNPPDLNLNTNLGVDNSLANFNFNTNLNTNLNLNLNTNSNTNLKTPTPTRTPTPSPSPTPDANSNVNTNTNVNTTRTPSPTPPAPNTSPPNTNRPVNVGLLNGRATNLPKPAYPTNARNAGASGQVAVQVTVDEAGNVTSAKATTGHPLLRAPSEAAARQTKFNPIRVGNQPVKATGILLYNFVNQ